MTDVNILDKTGFQTSEVLNFLKKSNVDPAFKAKKVAGTGAKKKSERYSTFISITAHQRYLST